MALMIDEGFWQDERISRLPIEARYLFIGLWSLADHRTGVLPLRPVFVRSRVLPEDDVPASSVEGWVAAIAGAGLLIPFEDRGERFAILPSWCRHQRFRHPRENRCPLPPRELLAGHQEALEFLEPEYVAAKGRRSASKAPAKRRQEAGEMPAAGAGAGAGAGAEAIGPAAPAEGAEPAHNPEDATPKKTPDRKPGSTLSPEAKRLVEYMDALARERCPDLEPLHPMTGGDCAAANSFTAARDAPKLRRIRFAIYWAHHNEFWRGQIRDIRSLTAKSNLKQILEGSAKSWPELKDEPELWKDDL